jgi:flagellin
MSTINTNYSALIVQNDLTVNNRTLGSAMEQLSTGKRINSAIDDASGVSMGSSRSRQIQGLNQAMRNANDGISMMQTAEGALSDVNNILNRMRELAVQAGNDTNTSQDRYALDKEYQQLNREVARITTNTQWNGMNILNASEVGAAGTASDVSAGVRNVKFHVGANSNQFINVGLKDFSYDLGIAAKTQETKLTLGDMRDKQYFQFSIAKDVINNGSTGTQTISFDLSRPIAGAVMTEDELVDFETQLTRAVTDTAGYSNVSVSRVGLDIYIKDQEGRAIGVTALTGGSTAATRGTSVGFSMGYSNPNTTSASVQVGTDINNNPIYWTQYTHSKTMTTFYLGDMKGKQNFSLSINGSNYSFDLSNRIAGASVTSDELVEFDTKLEQAIGASLLGTTAGKYSVTTFGSNQLQVTYHYNPVTSWSSTYYSPVANLTGGSTSETRGTTWGYAGTNLSTGQTATAAGSPSSTSVFSGSARLNDTRISTQEDANEAVGRIDSAMLLVDAEQAKFGSVMNRLERAGDAVMRTSQSTTFSRSRIMDADYAASTTEVVRQQIIQQAGMAMLTQANQLPASVLTLLK